MIPITTFANKKVAIFGLGGSGLASASALLAGGADVVAFDDNAASVAKANAAGIPTADLHDVDWSKIASLVLAPGVPLTHPAPHWAAALAQKAGVEVIGDIELFCRERRRRAPGAPFVAITGTNGKSTTTALIAHLAASAGMDAQLGGNIGTAILSLAPPRPDRVHVIECSSYQIDLAPSLDPSVGILINLSEDHLDRHGSMDHYAAVKERLVAGVPEGRHRDRRCRRRVVPKNRGAARAIGKKAWCRFLCGAQLSRRNFRRQHSRIMRAVTGEGHRKSPISAASARCAECITRRMPPAPRPRHLALGLDAAAIQAGLRSFPGLAHRMEEVGRRGAVLFVNDSKATNADSTAQALACFNDIFWIAGGKPKTGGIESLRGFFPRIRKAYLIGEAAGEFAATLGAAVPHDITGTLDKAVTAATRDAQDSSAQEPVVLLSPACASFDQYPQFRGSRRCLPRRWCGRCRA